MSAEIVNLRRARKRKARDEKERQADANRRRFGMPAGERERLAAERDLTARRLDGAKRSPGDAGDADPGADEGGH